MGSRLCIVGAGAAGAGAAYALRDAAVDVTILEKSRGVGGRAATRRKDGTRYDHGANYVKEPDERTADLLRSLGTDGLVDVAGPVWTVDAAGTVTEGDREEEHKWTWAAGITQLAKRLLAETDATVEKATRVADLAETGGEWTLTDTDGGEHGPFDAVLLTPPAPQTADLLAATESAALGDGVDAVAESVRTVPFRTIRSVLLHYPFELDRPYYALVDTSREHDVGWVSREECKPGHVPDGESLLVAQMSPDWSTAHYDDPLEEVAPVVAEKLADLMDDERLADPDWVDDQGWRYALPDDAVDPAAVDRAAGADLYLAGDWVVGDGRVHAALWNGVETGERIAETL